MNAATRAWIDEHDPGSLARAALDYTTKVAGLGAVFPPDAVLRSDFDADALAHIETELRDVDRRAALAHIAASVLRDAEDRALPRHEVLLGFVQRFGFANLWQPVDADGTSVRDPLALLRLGQLRCGHAATLAADLFEAAGFPTRLCLLGHHIVAEAQYDDGHGFGWHAIDADGFAGGVTPRRADGTIPSVAELSRDPDRLDRCASGTRPSFARLPDPPGSAFRHARILAPRALPTLYPSTAWFGADGAPPRPAGFRYARRNDEADRSGPDYGWKDRTVTVATDIVPGAGPEHRFPAAASIDAIAVTSATDRRRLDVRASVAGHDGCAAIRIGIHVDRRSRGWQYADAACPSDVVPFLVPRPWRPEQYERLQALPPSDVAHAVRATQDGTDVRFALDLPVKGDLYLTAMASDAHGRRVGRELYPLSPEFVLAP